MDAIRKTSVATRPAEISTPKPAAAEAQKPAAPAAARDQFKAPAPAAARLDLAPRAANNEAIAQKDLGFQVVVGPNVNVSNEDAPQSETDIATDPTDPNHLIGGSNSITQDGAMRAYESFDGGKTWSNQKLPLAPAPLNGFTSDPAVTFDKKGNAYYSFLGIDSQGNNTTLVNLSKPKGAKEWGGMTTVPNVNADKQLMTTDQTDGKYSGNLYIGWDNNNKDGTQSLMLASSADGGKTFNTAQVNNQGTNVIGADPAVGPNGEVYVAWSNYKDHTLNLNVSLDGGKTFSKTDSQIIKWKAPTGTGLDVKIPADPQRGVTVFPFIDVDRSNGPNRGTVYAAYNDGDTKTGLHTYLTSSKDGGKTWTKPVKVDDDTSKGRHDHFMPRVAVDQSDGSVNVVWYDTRNDAKNKKTDLYYSRSTDGGKTFEKNTKVTTAMSDETTPSAKKTGATPGKHGKVEQERTTDDVLSDANGYGDYIGITADKGVVHAFWADSRPGTKEEDVFSAAITHQDGKAKVS